MKHSMDPIGAMKQELWAVQGATEIGQQIHILLCNSIFKYVVCLLPRATPLTESIHNISNICETDARSVSLNTSVTDVEKFLLPCEMISGGHFSILLINGCSVLHFSSSVLFLRFIRQTTRAAVSHPTHRHLWAPPHPWPPQQALLPPVPWWLLPLPSLDGQVQHQHLDLLRSFSLMTTDYDPCIDYSRPPLNGLFMWQMTDTNVTVVWRSHQSQWKLLQEVEYAFIHWLPKRCR